jgi:8-oxo-dGTP pyrophosphatase MutT (NUDIX family)
LAFSIEKLSDHLKSVSNEQDANAAVALLLKVEGGRLNILFVRRVQNSRDPWAGQIALPGGKREAKDRDLKETIVRETLEETNINLLDHCRFLGVMSTFQSTPKPEIMVLPFVIIIENDPPIELSKKELEDYFWIPLEELAGNRTMAKLSLGEVPAFIVRGNVIWGLTYRIVDNFMRFIET